MAPKHLRPVPPAEDPPLPYALGGPKPPDFDDNRDAPEVEERRDDPEAPCKKRIADRYGGTVAKQGEFGTRNIALWKNHKRLGLELEHCHIIETILDQSTTYRISRQEVAQITGLSLSTVKRCLSALEAAGCVQIGKWMLGKSKLKKFNRYAWTGLWARLRAVEADPTLIYPPVREKRPDGRFHSGPIRAAPQRDRPSCGSTAEPSERLHSGTVTQINAPEVPQAAASAEPTNDTSH